MEEMQKKFELTITKDEIKSTDERFDINNLFRGDDYKPIEVYFSNTNTSEIKIHRHCNKNERRISNQTLPRLSCQIFENQISSLSDIDKQNFLICRYKNGGEEFRGIFSTISEFRNYLKSIEYVVYSRENGPQFVFYCWNIFSTLIFVQECLKRFGKAGDYFVLTYREKTDSEKKSSTEISEPGETKPNGSQNPYSEILLKSKNIIFRGAPGTGKSHLAKEIAADIISKGMYEKYSDLSEEQKEQVEFVQFHPNYDYSDFVEGLRPVINKDGSIGFELKPGIFSRFVEKARKNYENYKNSGEELKEYIFIIDEINRGEISKILGELFFSIEPGYRGKDGEVSTQYANMHENPKEKFYIPENVYIIGTMNDIDRSVDSFDFAMRRRFRFIEIKAEESMSMLDGYLDEDTKTQATKRMSALNKKIASFKPDLNENYQIGAAYFLRLKDKAMSFDELWLDCLKPVLQDYIRGMYNEKNMMKSFEEAYGYIKQGEEDNDENQG